MGVVSLWDIVKTEKKVRNVKDLEGQTLAVDLADWICEAEGVKSMQHSVTNPYLRNLFFRCSTFTRYNIMLVFVLDGEAPELKWKTISDRLNNKSEISKLKTNNSGTWTRNRLNGKFKQCIKLLDSLGFPWITCNGEAEALCAQLNSNGIVDAVMTSDGDAFLYGAKKIYKNFTSDKNECFVDTYNINDFENNLHLNRQSLIALALLLGCDYCPKGVSGIGKKQAVEFLGLINSKNPLDIFRLWRHEHNKDITEELPKSSKKPLHCSTCSHIGSKRDHKDLGCSICKDDCRNGKQNYENCTCSWHINDNKFKKSALLHKVKSAAMLIDNFPNEDIIKEFLSSKSHITSSLNSKDKYYVKSAPKFEAACIFLKEKLSWKVEYCVEKILPLISNHIMLNLANNKHCFNKDIKFSRINKLKIRNGIECVEIQWELMQNANIDVLENHLKTIEQIRLFKQAFPNEFKRFLDEQKFKKSKPSRTKKAKSESEVVTSMKITDFFVAKEKKVGIVSKPCTELSNLSPNENISSKKVSNCKQHQNEIAEIKPKMKSHEQHLKASPTSIDIKIPRSVTFLSSDSDEENENPDECLKHSLKPKHLLLLNNHSKSTLDQNITFSQELNFSLDISSLSTPTQENAKKSSCSATVQSPISIPFNSKNMNIVSTPSNKTINKSEMDNPESPMFLSLFERLKLKRGEHA